MDGKEIDDDLFALSREPDMRVRIFSACLVNGVRYHTVDREKNRRTQNSGILTDGTHNGESIDFYGCLKNIIELKYFSESSDHRTVVLFRCDWFDTHGKKFKMKDDGIFRSINHGSLWYKDDPFILASMAAKVFYLEDNKYRDKWRVVQKFAHRHLWNVDEIDKDDIPNAVLLSYQDDECVVVQVALNEGNVENEQPPDENYDIVDADVVDDLRRQREEEVEQDESNGEEDGTELQYFSDNDSPTCPADEDDDSDYE